ncbi:MAG TPA: SPOR domain-containing protein [Steroidobacteraceae bacterium]|nr:SPOR domain-containing protein [Steroidobacteraceae bacterium]
MAGPSTGARTLSRDYKDVRRHKHVAVGHTFNGWVGLGVGLSLGLLVALGVHLHYTRQAQATAEPVPAPPVAPASAAATDDAMVGTPETNAAEPGLDFYDMLPKQEVEVPAHAKNGKAARPPLPTGDVVLQAGSFKQPGEAEKMLAKLAYLGIDARIQRAPVDDETWYRVRIGPIATVEELHAVQSKLQEAEISATPVAPVEEAPLP